MEIGIPTVRTIRATLTESGAILTEAQITDAGINALAGGAR
jgi:hypothetical protein